MAPIIFIGAVSLVLLLMLFWVLRDGTSRSHSQSDYQFESAQELFKYVDVEDEVYLGENCIQLLRISPGRVRAYWNLDRDKWGEISKSNLREKNREPFVRFYQAGELLHTFDMPLKQRSGHFDFDLPPQTACYCSLGCKENSRFSAIITSRTLMRQC